MKDSEIKAKFNEEIAPLLIKRLKKGVKRGNILSLKETIPIFKGIVLQTAQTQKINAQTAKDIIALLRTGKVSIADAKDLMTILKDKAEIDELPKLLKKLEELERKN